MMVPNKIERLRLGALRQCKHLEIYDIEMILAVAESGSFRGAGQLIGISQSAVTRRIQKIEDVLGVSMFERSQAGARLTAAGWHFATHYRRLGSEFLNVVRAARSAGTAIDGKLHLGLIASLSRGALREVVIEFLAEHSGVELTFTEADRGELMTLMSHRIVDVVMSAGAPPTEYGDMILLTNEQLYIAVAEDHPLAEKCSVRWRDVQSMPFVVGAVEPGPEIHDYIIRRVSDLGRQACVQEHRVDREGIMNLVGLGLGVTLMCEHWRGIRYPNVAFIPLEEDGKAETIPFSLTWRPENDNPALRRFLSLARGVAKADAASSGPS